MSIDLSGRSALVTGGNRGIGLAAVAHLAQAGATVTFTARSQDRIDAALEEIDSPEGVTGVVCDATDLARVAEVAGPGFDILVNNAGVIGPIGALGEVPIEDWGRNIQTNVVAAFHVIQQVLPAMRERGEGVIVNLSSGAARAPLEGWSAYCAGKAALAMITRSVALEEGEGGVRIFGFAPGVVDTGMQGEIRASGINRVSQLPRESLAPASEPGQAIAWLCTEAAGHYTGQEVDIRDPDFRKAAGLPAVG